MEQRLNVITLGVQNLERSRAFYEMGLGWKASPLSRNEAIILFQIGGMVLSLFPKDRLAEDVGLELGHGFGGITLAYNARSQEEVRTILDKAEKAGGKIIKPAQNVFWGGYSGYFTDPDGYIFEVAWNPYWPLDDKGKLNIGEVLIGLALFRILFFDLLVYNPVWTHQYVGYFPILNALLLSYGLPVLWLILTNQELVKIGKQNYLPYTNSCLFALVFLFVSFNVRQLYHNPYLDKGVTSNAEVYTYSAVWLLTGIGLLFFGTLKHDKTIRIASLAFMVLTIAKVFLYDASELTGLFRVFSFLGLGISLLGLSWFYTRFVFRFRTM